jgi:hypothetical protein
MKNHVIVNGVNYLTGCAVQRRNTARHDPRRYPVRSLPPVRMTWSFGAARGAVERRCVPSVKNHAYP